MKPIVSHIVVLIVISWLTVGNRGLASPYHFTQVIEGVDRYHSMISEAVKDPSGTIWLVSGGLLYRYDGVNVTPFSKLYGKTLPFDEVSRIVADPWGRLWMDTRNGLYVFDIHLWSFVSDSPYVRDLQGKGVVAFFDTPDALYAALVDGVVWQISASAKKLLFRFDARAVHERKPVGRLLVADVDHVWLAFADKLYGFDLHAGQMRSAGFPSGMFNQLEDLLPVVGGVLLRVYSQGYTVFDGKVFKYLPRNDFRTNDFTNWNHWSFIRGDRVIVFHENKYLEYSRDTAFKLLLEDTHILDTRILHKRINAWHYGDNEWLLGTDQGLFSVFLSKINFGFMESGSARGMVKQQDRYFFGGYGYLHTWAPNGVLEPYMTAPENNYYAFLPLSADTVAIAMEGDFLNYLVNGRVIRAPLDIPDNTREQFSGMAYCLVRQSADTLLLGTSNGIWKYAMSSGQVYPLLDGRQEFGSRGMKVQSVSLRNGSLSFTSDEGFFTVEKGKFRKLYPADKMKLNIYTHIYRNDSVYLATKGRGLVIMDRLGKHNRAIRMENGLASNFVYQLMWIDSALFMGTHEGLSVKKGHRLLNYYHTDGLPFEEFNHQAAYYDKQEDWAFMGGTGGYTRFHPSDLLTDDSEMGIDPVLSGLRMGLKSNRFVSDYAGLYLRDTIDLPSDAVWFSMEFARPNIYRKAYKTLFRIAPLMEGYQEMPASYQINLSGIAAGSYAVSVKILPQNSGEEGITKTWTLHKKPSFMETPLFYLLICFGIAAIAGNILYERARKVGGERRLRLKISRDLHDEVGYLLTGISLQADLAKLKELPVQLGLSVDAISHYSREAVQMMDDIIWAFDSRNNLQGNLSDRIKYIASQLLEKKGIAISYEFDLMEDRKMPQSVRQNLYLIFKEAVHNVYKHSDASIVKIGLTYGGGQIVLYILDDGQKRISTGSARQGQGLRNMQLRASQIGATLRTGYTTDGYEVRVCLVLKNPFMGWLKNPFAVLRA